MTVNTAWQRQQTDMINTLGIFGNSACLGDTFAGYLARVAGFNALLDAPFATIVGRSHKWQTTPAHPRLKGQLALRLNKFNDLNVVCPSGWIVG